MVLTSRKKKPVFALGSCRVHDPLLIAHRHGRIEYLNRRFRSRAPIYLQDVFEMVQFVRLATGQATMPKELGPFAFHHGLRLDRGMPGLLVEAEHFVVEICTDKHYAAAGFVLNLNEICRQLVDSTGAAGQEWWLEVNRGHAPNSACVATLEAVLGARLTPSHRTVLREVTFRQLSTDEIAAGLSDLKALVKRPILVMPHVTVRLPDGQFLAERLSHVEKTLAAAAMVGCPILNPVAFIERDGQQRALDKAGTDFNHYAQNYLSVVGAEITSALRDLAYHSA